MPLVFVESVPDGLECYSQLYPCTSNKHNSNGSDGDNNDSWQLQPRVRPQWRPHMIRQKFHKGFFSIL